MTDDELIEAFEAETLPPASFRHRHHVQLAWLYLTRHGRAEAERRLVAGLEALARRAGRPDKFDAALTRAWIAAIAEAFEAHRGRSLDDVLAACPGLLDPRLPVRREVP